MKLTEEKKQELFNVALASSVVLFGFNGEKLQIYLKSKQKYIDDGIVALPSTYVMPKQGNEKQVRMLLNEDFDVNNIYLEQLKAFGHVYRNPMGRVINIAFYALIKLDEATEKKTKEHDGFWVNYEEVPELGFDHNEVVEYAKERLKRRVKRRPVGFNLLPEKFTIRELQMLYESALRKELDKRNFRKKIFKSELIKETGEKTKTELTRKATKLYTFDQDKYKTMTLRGYDFLF